LPSQFFSRVFDGDSLKLNIIVLLPFLAEFDVKGAINKIIGKMVGAGRFELPLEILAKPL
jgi:hypothetical protein